MVNKTLLLGIILACAILFPLVAAEPIMTNNTDIPSPVLTANLASSTIIRGNPVSISGIANSSSVMIYVTGTDIGNPFEVHPDNNGYFILELTSFMTSNYPDGTYNIIVHHPGADGDFNIIFDNGKGYLRTENEPVLIRNFELPYRGSSLRGDDAVWAILDAISQGDDLYQEFSFEISPPTPSPTPTPTPTIIPTTTVTTVIPTTVETTATPTPEPTTAVTTAIPTTYVTTVIPTTEPEPTPLEILTGTPQQQTMEMTSTSANIEEQIAVLNEKVETHEERLNQQEGWIEQIMNYLRSLFGWS